MLLSVQFQPTTLPALIFGAALVVVGIVMCTIVWRSRQAQEHLVAHDDHARRYADRQFRRRMQVGVMLGLIGILIAAGDQMEKMFARRPLLFLGWLVLVFVMVILVIVMALGDWLSTVAYSAVATGRLRHERRELEDEIRRYHAMKNGHPVDEGNDPLSTGNST